MLTQEVAQHIVDEIIVKLGRNINIMNEKGIIIASGDAKRIGTLHEGALKTLETGETFMIYEDHFRGSKPGINLPLSFNGEQVGVVGITGDPKDIMEFGSLVVTMTELMLQRVALLDESEWKERLKGFLLDECLKREPDELKIRHKAKLLDIEWASPYQIMVFSVQEPKDDAGGSLGLYRKIAETLTGKDLLYDFVDDEHIVILRVKAQEDPDLEQLLMKTLQKLYHVVRLGIEDIYDYLSETRGKYKRILKAFDLSQNQIVRTSDISSILLLSTTSSAEGNKYLQMALALTPELRKTLVVFFENNLNISQAAQSLFIHRNTMIYRLERITDITGKNPQNFRDAWDLQCGLWLTCTISWD